MLNHTASLVPIACGLARALSFECLVLCLPRGPACVARTLKARSTSLRIEFVLRSFG